MARLLVRTLCGLVLALVRVRVKAQGAIPKEPALLLANHLGWLDILAILAHHDCSVVAKCEVRAWPVIGPLAEAFGVVWIDRRRKRDLLRAIPELAATLRDGRSVLVFPEGTTGDGRALLPFKSALVEAAVRANVPVVPLALSGGASRGDVTALCWIGEETLIANLPRLFALRGATLVVHAAPAIASRGSRKVRTAEARAAIARRVDGGAIRSLAPADSASRAIAGVARTRGAHRHRFTRLRQAVTFSLGLLLAIVAGVSLLYAAAPIYAFGTPQPFTGLRWYNPYERIARPATRRLQANLHAHSRVWGGVTDGRQSPAVVAAAYRAMHYDVIGISNYQANPRQREPGTFPVYEHGWNLRKSHHLAIGATDVLWLDLPFGGSRHQQQYLLDLLHASSPLVAITHPAIRGARTAGDLAALSGYELLEVLNHFTAPSDSLWDAALTSGRAIWLLAGDDSHDVTGAGETGTNATMVFATDTAVDAVLDALRRGAMYGTRTPRGMTPLRLTALEVRADTLRVTVAGAVTRMRIVGAGGHVRLAVERASSARDTVMQLTLPVRATDSYLRVVAEGPGRALYTNPVLRWNGGELPRGAATIDGPRTALWRALWIFGYAWCAAWGLGRALVPREEPTARGVPIPQ